MNNTNEIKSSYAAHIANLQSGYDAALDATGFDGVILHSGRGLKKLTVDDQYWPLNVNPSFAQWLPLQDANTLVVVQKGKTPTLIRPISTSFWEGPAPVASDHYESSFTVVDVSADAVATALPQGKLAWIGNTLEAARELKVDVDATNPGKLQTELDALRVIKSPYEITCLTEATRIATLGHAHVAKLFAQGQYSELDLHLEYLRVTQQDASQTPYGNIVAQGQNAAILHHVHYGKSVDTRENLSLLIDAGATSMGYASDITRTYVRGSSEAAQGFARLLDGMDELALELCDQVKPGMPYEELHNSAHTLLAKLLLKNEICPNADAQTLVDEGITRAFFPHGLGHSLGLQVHDVGCRLSPPSEKNPFLRNTSTITAGQFFTIEPGCYFIPALLGPLKESASAKFVSWSTVDRLSPFGGIRIEDNLLVTQSASINLTRDNWPSQP